MYRLDTPLAAVKGIGPQLQATFSEHGLLFVRDLLLQLPNRYNDLSKQVLIAEALPGESLTIRGTVVNTSNYFRGGRSIQRATISDATGKLDLLWFNAHHITQSLIKGQEYFFSGSVGSRGGMVHPSFEKISDNTIHTNRLVPIYTSTLGIQQGRVRRLCKHILEFLDKETAPHESLFAGQKLPSLRTALSELHFPSDEELVITARERLAAEELVTLIRQAKKSKALWAKLHSAPAIKESKPIIPPSIPFTLTASQQTTIGEILVDIGRTQPMNRLLTGDVGSGKTVVAGIAARQVINQGLSACLVAPTKVLAEQHAKTLKKLFPDVPVTLVTSAQRKKVILDKPQFFVGTHALFSLLAEINPVLLIYDEQHRFGVKQRLAESKLISHRLTMTATPIPRSLSLSLFAHLDHSQITELPLDRIPTKTWILPAAKRAKLYDWIETQVAENPQYLAILVCPFIDQSKEPGLAQIAAANVRFKEIKKRFGPKYKVGILHGRQSPAEQQEILAKLFAQEINVLVSTPIVEVGIDLPQASALVIESAEQYGLASLHQLRGRVGRAGQQGYCYLFTSSAGQANTKRLQQLLTTTDGHKLAEFDLANRG
ncbi:MAG: hypothetical protein COU68_02160, partial [Candidatus Pacebacteria bacterium CG10_big_fil_rev_8_21_14_0_10_45_6]